MSESSHLVKAAANHIQADTTAE